MNPEPHRRPGRLAAAASFLVLSVAALQYSYYRIFSVFRPYDDEGTMMVRNWMILQDASSFGVPPSTYGPFYYLHKYILSAWFGLAVSNDATRLTTIVLWALVAVAGAVLVYRLSRSLIIAAVLQMLLILHMQAFINEPGHPQEIALTMLSVALLCATGVHDGRRSTAAMLGLGAATGALLLVKVNLGIFLALPLAVALLYSLPKSLPAVVLSWSAAAAAVLLPPAVMWRHIQAPGWGRNYCALVCLTVAAAIVASLPRCRGRLDWQVIGKVVLGLALSIAGTFGLLLAWGNSLAAISSAVILRAADFAATLVVPAPIGDEMVRMGALSLGLASFYALIARFVDTRDSFRFLLALAKLGYGVFALYQFYVLGPGLLRILVPVPFLWLLLVKTGGPAEATPRDLFARILLCLTAAYQTLQAYPVHGSQATWAVFLVAPVAGLCVADAWSSIVELARRRLPAIEASLPAWLRPATTTLLLAFAAVWFLRVTDIPGIEAAYYQQSPLDLPGASRLRLPQNEVAQYRWLAKNVSERCDGFLGAPGFGSLYFWTGIHPPATINGAWVISMDEATQKHVIEKMRSYQRPCVVQNMHMVGFWTGAKPLDPRKPLVRYINEEFQPGPQHGNYTLMLKRPALR